jgi:Zn-dependent M28 family amino/carboxypeptidase
LKNASSHIQKLYEGYFSTVPAEGRYSNFELSGMSGGSDYFSFLEIGIPAGGLATGAGGLKSEAERIRHGGFANAPYDPCYHQSCDTIWNIGVDLLERMTKSAASFVEQAGLKKDLRKWLSS